MVTCLGERPDQDRQQTAPSCTCCACARSTCHFPTCARRVRGRPAWSSGLRILCLVALLAGCRAARQADGPSSEKHNGSGTIYDDGSVQAATWSPEAKALFPQEKVEQPWAQRIETRLRDGLAALAPTQFACFSSQCVLQVSGTVAWPALESTLAQLWNYEFAKISPKGARKLPDNTEQQVTPQLARQQERNTMTHEGVTFIRLLRHPADRSGTTHDGMPSVGAGPTDACLAGFDCKLGALGQWTLELENDELCFTSPTEMCLCAERQGRDCPRYDY